MEHQKLWIRLRRISARPWRSSPAPLRSHAEISPAPPYRVAGLHLSQIGHARPDAGLRCPELADARLNDGLRRPELAHPSACPPS
jgi:hypothetical protein